MIVERFLKTRGGAELVTVGPSATIAETARLLTAKKKGLALVCDANEELLGVVSVIDITRAVGQYEARAPAMRVESVMTKDCCTCQLSESVDSALGKMTERGIRHLPVLEGKRLKGMLNMRGLLKHRFEEAEVEVAEMRNYVIGVGYH